MKLNKEAIGEIFQITVGIILASIGLKAFLLPNGFLDGGVTGIAILISRLSGIDISILLIVFSIPFLALAYYTVSKRIFFKSLLSILTLALIIHYESFTTITDDKLLISIFGGLFLGAGIGITIRNGAVLDGSEVLGIFLNDRFGLSIGRVILMFNVILFAAAAITLSTEVAMYSILTYLVTAKVIDFLIKGFEDFIGLRITSKYSEEIKDALINNIGVGVTLYQAEGGYGKSGERKKMLIIDTVVNRLDMRKVHRLVDKIDAKAFVIEYDVNAIKGGILRKYLARKGKKAI
ncbi:MAG: YitT family protein [Vicingaceae bacterium]